jgi:ABC-type multidrug transport system, ATPase component
VEQFLFVVEIEKRHLQEWLHIIGSLSHENRLYGDLSSIDNLRLFGTLYGVNELNIKIDNILEQIDLTHVARLPVRNFSSGMTKRLMIGRLMLYQPKF